MKTGGFVGGSHRPNVLRTTGVLPHGCVRRWFDKAVDRDLFTSVFIAGELRRGVESIRRHDRAAADGLAQWLESLVERFGDRLLPIDAAVANRWDELNVPDPVPTVDGLLAATALVHDLTLVTRNVRDAEKTGVRWLDPFADRLPAR